MDPGPIADAAADAAVAKVEAEDAKETAEEVEGQVEVLEERVESQWNLTEGIYSDLERRVAQLETPPQTEAAPSVKETSSETPNQPEGEGEPPTLEMEVKEPPKKKRGLSAKRGASRIKFW